MSSFFEQLEGQLRTAVERRHNSPVASPSRRWRNRRNASLIAIATVGLATPALARVTGLWKPDVRRWPTTEIGTTSQTPDRPGRAVPQGPQYTKAPVARELANTFGVLRQPRTREDVFPTLGREGLKHVNRETIRYVGSADGRRYFLVPGASFGSPDARGSAAASTRRAEPAGDPSSSGCLLADNGSGGCFANIAAVRRTGTGGSSLRKNAPGAVVVGLVPDGVRAVTIRYGPSTRTLAIRRNFYAYTVALDPAQALDHHVVWHLADGTTRRIR